MYVICWVPNPLKRNQMLGAGKRKNLCSCCQGGKKIRAWFPVCHPLQGGWCCFKFLLRFGGGGNVNKTEGKKVLVDPSHSPKNLEISRVWYSYLGGAPKELNLKS